jgi:hypothetical protein
MKPKKQISAREITHDLHSDMSDQDLMVKYKLTSMGLQSVFKKLLAAGLIGENELRERMPSFQDTAELIQSRTTPRHYPLVRVPIFDLDDLSIETYYARDLSEKGVQVAGMSIEVGTQKTFVIQIEDFAEFLPFHFEAECKWNKPATDEAPMIAGFSIQNISDDALEELRKVLVTITFKG